MMIDKANGKLRINCIIMTRGVIPNFGAVMGPILDPRPIEVDDVYLLLKMGVDLRAVDRNDRKPDPKKALKLNDKEVKRLVDEFVNGKPQPKKVEQPKPQQQPKKVEEKKVEQPKPQQQPKKEVKQPEVKKDEIVEIKEVKQPEQKQVNNKVNKK